MFFKVDPINNWIEYGFRKNNKRYKKCRVIKSETEYYELNGPGLLEDEGLNATIVIKGAVYTGPAKFDGNHFVPNG